MNKKKEFWNARAKLRETAGSNDFNLKKLEINIIVERVKENSSVLDIGCGNGETLRKLVENRNCSGTGIDFSDEMIALAKDDCSHFGHDKKLQFLVGSLPNLPINTGQFDYILTQRCLINLDNKELQYEAFKKIMTHLKINGHYLMIESSIQGLDRTNELRNLLGLENILPPWHNVFFDEDFVLSWENEKWSLEEIVPLESTYHFLSRVVYAGLAKNSGEELRYDSDINLLALKLPIIGNFGPVKLWHWRKK